LKQRSRPTKFCPHHFPLLADRIYKCLIISLSIHLGVAKARQFQKQKPDTERKLHPIKPTPLRGRFKGNRARALPVADEAMAQSCAAVEKRDAVASSLRAPQTDMGS